MTTRKTPRAKGIASPPKAFVPEHIGPHEPGRRLFGARFSSAGSYALGAAITAAYGKHPDYWLAMCEIEREHGIYANNVYVDDAKVYVAEALGIEWRQFEHNVPLIEPTGFDAYAAKLFPDIKRPLNAMQWDVVRSRLYDAWVDWQKASCESRGCELEYHGRCWVDYRMPCLWHLALRIATGELAQPQPSLTMVWSRD